MLWTAGFTVVTRPFGSSEMTAVDRWATSVSM